MRAPHEAARPPRRSSSAAALATAAVALLVVSAGAGCARGPSRRAPEARAGTAPAPERRQPAPGERSPFPEVCGEADDALACARVPVALPPGAVLGGPVLELAGVERDLPGAEVKVAARTARGWVELPFVLSRTPPCEGEAQVGRLVDVGVTFAEPAERALLVRVQTATRLVGGAIGARGARPARDLDESVYLCTFESVAPSCTRVRTAWAPDVVGVEPLADASWRREREVRVGVRGQVVIAPAAAADAIAARAP